MDVKEFLTRRGPAGIPYWGLGLMGVAVIAGTIWLQKSGALSGLTGALSPTGGGAGAGGDTASSAPTTPTAVTDNTAGVVTAPDMGLSGDPLLVGQQDGSTGSGFGSAPIGPTSIGDNFGVNPYGYRPPGRQPGPSPLNQAQTQAGTAWSAVKAVPFTPSPAAQAWSAVRSIPLSTPVPTTQTQVVQYTAPRLGGALE